MINNFIAHWVAFYIRGLRVIFISQLHKIARIYIVCGLTCRSICSNAIVSITNAAPASDYPGVSIMHRHDTRDGHWACSVNRFVIMALLNWAWSLWLHYKAMNYIKPSEWAIDFCHEIWVQMDNISTNAVCNISSQHQYRNLFGRNIRFHSVAILKKRR